MQLTKSSFALSMVKGAAMMMVLLSALGAFAGTESVLWNFGSVVYDGNSPAYNGMVFDTKGNLYGATVAGGEYNAGVVFELSPDGRGGWTETLLHSFDPYSTSVKDGYGPCGSLAIDSKGNIYGTTAAGGTNGTGTVWELSPPAAGGTTWTETILYSFGAPGSGDGFTPYAGVTLATSAATTLYGTTQCGGTGPVDTLGVCSNGSGAVYQLSYKKPTKKVKGGWTETVLYSFAATSSADGVIPWGALALKGKNLYGVTPFGGTGAYCIGLYGSGCGIAFALQPGADGWAETVLYNFGATATDAAIPGFMTPVIDSKNNIYGTTSGGGYGPDGFNCGCGTVWELAYSSSDKTYTEQVLYSFDSQPKDGLAPYWQIVKGKKANTWFGATSGGGSVNGTSGTIFELTYSKKKGWQETNVYQFTGALDGGVPGYNQLIADKSGNLYGMTWTGGSYYEYGVVFEFQP